MWCESCADGTDLSPGGTCSCCRTTKKIVRYRKCEYPMTEDDENEDIPVTELVNE